MIDSVCQLVFITATLKENPQTIFIMTHTIAYMRSHPQEFIGTLPGKNVNNHILRLFLDMVIRHYPEANVFFEIESCKKWENGINGASHFAFTENELATFTRWLQAYSSDAILDYCSGKYGRQIVLCRGELVHCKDYANTRGITLTQFSFIPDTSLFDEWDKCVYSEHEFHAILTDYKHLYPELNIRRGAHSILPLFEVLPNAAYNLHLETAARLVVKEQVASYLDLSRHLCFGNQQVNEMMNQLEKIGIIGPKKDGVNERIRDVLVKNFDELEDILKAKLYI